MKIYRIIIRTNKYPSEFTIEASSIATAVARAIREFKKKWKGSKISEMNIKVIIGGTLLRENDKD